jgi:trimeric autotransporter adhesin
MSLTKVSYSMIEGAPVNVVDYGASTSATGVANSAAFLAAKAVAGTYTIAGQTIFRQVYVPPATYAIDGTVVGNFFTDGVVGITGGTVQYIIQQGVGASQSNTIFGPGAMPGATLTGGDNGQFNTAFGTEALISNTTGYRNTGIGYAALHNTVTNYANTAVGASAGYSLSDPAATGNTAVGSRALFTSTDGYFNTAIGSDSLQYNTSGYSNTGCGKNTLYTNSTGYFNTAVGLNALLSNETGFQNTAVGFQALAGNVLGINNVAVGFNSLLYATNGGNTAVGRHSCLNTVGGYNLVAIGDQALLENVSGNDSVAVGVLALSKATGSQNTAIGRGAGFNVTLGEGNLILGSNSNIGYTPVFDITTENNRVVVSSTSVTNAYVQVAWTIVSDERDKTDVEDSPYGLSFVQSLRPVVYKRDDRDRYKQADADGNITEVTKDGSRKDEKFTLGFLAQEIIAAEKAAGIQEGKFLIADDEMADKLKITETKIIPALVKAIQELKAEFELYKTAQEAAQAKIGE